MRVAVAILFIGGSLLVFGMEPPPPDPPPQNPFGIMCELQYRESLTEGEWETIAIKITSKDTGYFRTVVREL